MAGKFTLTDDGAYFTQRRVYEAESKNSRGGAQPVACKESGVTLPGLVMPYFAGSLLKHSRLAKT